MYPSVLAAQIAVLSYIHGLADRAHSLQTDRSRLRRQAGQSTAEYALVLLGAATVALVFVAWAGKSSRISKLFNAVLDSVIGKI